MGHETILYLVIGVIYCFAITKLCSVQWGPDGMPGIIWLICGIVQSGISAYVRNGEAFSSTSATIGWIGIIIGIILMIIGIYKIIRNVLSR